MNAIEYKGVKLFPTYDSEAGHFCASVIFNKRQVAYISGTSVKELRENLKDAVDEQIKDFGPIKATRQKRPVLGKAGYQSGGPDLDNSRPLTDAEAKLIGDALGRGPEPTTKRTL